MSFTKFIVAFLLINSTIWIYASYYLAYIGQSQIAEILSKTVVVEILGVITVYAVKAGAENLSKNNNWPDRVCRLDESVIQATAESEMKEGDANKV